MSRKDLYKIRAVCNWSSSGDLVRDWFAKMSENPQLCQSDNIRIVSDNDNDNKDYDYTIIMNKPWYPVQFDPSKTIVFQLEPWCYDEKSNWGVKTWGEWAKPDKEKFMCVRDHKTYVNLLHWETLMTVEELETQEIVKKTSIGHEGKPDSHNVSIVTTSKYFDPGHIVRLDLVRYLEEHDYPIDVYGYDNYHKFKSYRGPHPSGNKNACILPYKYYLQCENNDEYNFITEKIWESVLSECVIFYWGCHNVSDYVHPDCYILLDPHDNARNLETIKKAIENDEWSKRIDTIKKEKKRLMATFNVFPILRQLIMRKEERPIDIWIHACSKGAGMEILDSQLRRVRNSLLYNRVRKIHIGIVGEMSDPLECFQSSLINVYHLSNIPSDGEYKTIRHFMDNLLDPQGDVLYFHTKGVSHPGDKKNRDWREMMEYFVIDEWEKAHDRLDENDVVGCNLSKDGKNPVHFSGNFWWARGSYLLKNKSRLGKEVYRFEDGYYRKIKAGEDVYPLEELRTFPSVEFWIASYPEAILSSLHNSGINHYLEEYDQSKYVR